MTIREAEYSLEDQARLIADWHDEREPRNQLGTKLSESTDPKSQYEWESDLPTTDFQMATLGKVRDAYQKQYPDADMASLLWAVKKRERE